MLFNKHAVRLSVLALAALIGMWESPARAQESTSGAATVRPESTGAKAETSERDDITQLKAELARLRVLIEQQQLKLGEMEKRLAAADGKGIGEAKAVMASDAKPHLPAGVQADIAMMRTTDSHGRVELTKFRGSERANPGTFL